MTLTYRTRRRLHNLAVVLLTLVLAALCVWLVWMLWLDRYVVYSRDGATIDFSRSAEDLTGEVAVPPGEDAAVSIYFNDGENAISTSTEMTQLSGYYISGTIMQEQDMAQITQWVKSLPTGTAVMLDVKNIYGNFYYTSSLGPTSTVVSAAQVDSLISYLRTSGLYVIGRVSAFRDYEFGLNNVSCGLFLPSGIGLWMDDDSTYWLDPANSGTLNYLIKIVSELKSLGFDEVVFDDFCFPETESITYEGDKTEALTSAAATLVSSCASETFAVSFITELGDFTLPTGRTRVYLENVSASQISSTVDRAALTDPVVELVFLTEAKDTRFNEYGNLRPITSGNFDS